jgi:hypothetical protein
MPAGARLRPLLAILSAGTDHLSRETHARLHANPALGHCARLLSLPSPPSAAGLIRYRPTSGEGAVRRFAAAFRGMKLPC